MEGMVQNGLQADAQNACRATNLAMPPHADRLVYCLGAICALGNRHTVEVRLQDPDLDQGKLSCRTR